MKKQFLLTSLIIALATTLAQAVEQPVITVIPASGPNGFGGAGYPAWQVNAVDALYDGAATAGTPGTPSYYQQAGATMSVSENLVTSFPSWKGSADPVGDYGAAFAGEYGNRLLFGLTIDGKGQQFSISQLSFVGDSTDPGNTLDFGFGPGSYNYGVGYQGVLFGADNTWGGGDDTFITSGLNTQLVDGLVGRGSGNAWWPGGGPVPPGTEQATIDAEIAALTGQTPFDFIGTYTLDLSTPLIGSAKVTFVSSTASVPDKGSTALMLAAPLAGLMLFRRNKWSAAVS